MKLAGLPYKTAETSPSGTFGSPVSGLEIHKCANIPSIIKLAAQGAISNNPALLSFHDISILSVVFSKPDFLAVMQSLRYMSL